MRKVRIIFNDPYATDDSSGDELPKPPRVKRIVHEISLPAPFSKSCQAATTSRKKSPRQWNLPLGVRLRKSGKYAAQIRDPITRTTKWLGTYKTCEEATKAVADKKLEYDALASLGPAVSSSVVTVNTHCLRSPYPAPVHTDNLSRQKLSRDEDVATATKEECIDFDFSDLEIPDLSFLAPDEESMVSDANGWEQDLDRLLMDDDTNHPLDNFSLLDNDINICGSKNSIPNELPDFDFTDVELELSDLKLAFADQVVPPLNIACP